VAVRHGSMRSCKVNRFRTAGSLALLGCMGLLLHGCKREERLPGWPKFPMAVYDRLGNAWRQVAVKPISRRAAERSILRGRRTGRRLIVLAEVFRAEGLVRGAPLVARATSLYAEAMRRPETKALAGLRLMDLVIARQAMEDGWPDEFALESSPAKALEEAKAVDPGNGFWDLLDAALGHKAFEQGAEDALKRERIDSGIADVLKLAREVLDSSEGLPPLFFEHFVANAGVAGLTYVSSWNYIDFFLKSTRPPNDDPARRRMLELEGRLLKRLHESFDSRLGHVYFFDWRTIHALNWKVFHFTRGEEEQLEEWDRRYHDEWDRVSELRADSLSMNIVYQAKGRAERIRLIKEYFDVLLSPPGNDERGPW